jgi:Gpi18-like mannosyltransferase
MNKDIKTNFLLFLFSVVPTLLIWLPFFLRIENIWSIPLPRNGLATIVANYDGPLYLIVAKTFYNVNQIKEMFSFPIPVEYYAAHFPLFPLLIKLLSYLINYPYAMLSVTLLSSFLAIYFFKKLLEEYVSQKNVLWLCFVFSIFPARWLIVRSVGSPEPLFIASIIASVYYFKKKKFLISALWGVIAQLTKSPAILLFIGLILSVLIPQIKDLALVNFKKWLKNFPFSALFLTLMPASLISVFALYQFTFNDFLAYFHSGDNIHLFFPPFQIFNYSAPWVNTHWLEEVIFLYLFAALGILKLIKQKRQILAWVSSVFFASIIFVSHRDVLRYALPIVPFILIAYSEELSKKEFKIAFALILIPIYLYSLAFISRNVMPISDWSTFL